MRDQLNFHALDVAQTAARAEVDLATGLTKAAAAARLKRFGPNRITARRETPAWLKFAQQFAQPLVYILVAASAVTALLGEWIDSAVIFAVVLVNAGVGFLQESKAEKAIGSLAALITCGAIVRRDGTRHSVDSGTLVPGDVVLLQTGDRVPADMRLVRIKSLHVDESALTGESVPVNKVTDALRPDTLLADRTNMAFTGTLVTAGSGEGVVIATGDRTQTGRIAELISAAVDLSTPLTRKIAQLSRQLLWAILVLAAVTLAVGVGRGETALEMFMAAVALAVGAIPEGLPAAVTVVLAIGVARMARRRAIIRKLPAVETLGSTTVICSDKTGTLTENQMTVQEIFTGATAYEITGVGYETAGEIRHAGKSVQLRDHPALAECLLAGVLCNDALLVRGLDGRTQIQGDPTEAALLVVAAKGGIAHADAHAAQPRVDVIPFESEHMFRATLHDRSPRRVIYKIGALERVLERCTSALQRDGSHGPMHAEAVRKVGEGMARRGLRVLALARRDARLDHSKLEHRHVLEGLTFLGIVGMIDPPRPEAIAAVHRCREAGIAVKMITGDHLGTARAIAEQVGIATACGGAAALSGRELETTSESDLPELAENTAVFARVAPEQKLRLVHALQARGHVVAMTGDGVNDAPALRQADIGVAMGRSGTEVAKAAAAMVLTDDNFATIEAAIEEGRGVFDNLTKFIVWTLPTNAGEALILLVAIFAGSTLPILPVQLLWINMTTAVLLGLMLVFEAKEPGLMQRPPRDPQRPLLTFHLVMRTGLVALVMLGGAYWLFSCELQTEGQALAAARTAVVNVIVCVEIAYLFNCRSLHRSSFTVGLLSNRWAIAGAAAMLGLQLLFTYSPLLNHVFHSAPLRTESWLRILAVALAVFGAIELEKWIRYGRGRGEHVVPS